MTLTFAQKIAQVDHEFLEDFGVSAILISAKRAVRVNNHKSGGVRRCAIRLLGEGLEQPFYDDIVYICTWTSEELPVGGVGF